MKTKVYLVLVAAMLSVMAACAPQPVTPTTPSPVLSAPTPTPVPTSNPPSPTSQDISWANAVAAAKKQGMVTIYSFYYVGDTGRALAKAFQDRYGIRVDILASSGRETVEKVKVEQAMKQPVADIVDSGASSATELSLAGLGEPVWREIPSLRDRSQFLVDPVYSPLGDVLWSSLTLITPAINTNLVKPREEPKSFKDFLDPKWKGAILSVDPHDGGSGLFNTIMTMRYFKVLDDDYWRQMVPQLQLFGGSEQEVYRMVARGEYKVALPGSDLPVAPLIAEGAPLKLVPMDEGVVAQGEAIMVVKGSPHMNAAKLFIDWLFSAEGQDVYARVTSTNPLRKGVLGHMVAGASLNPRKIVNRTWEAAQAGNDYQKAGVIDQIFGKK